MRMGIACIYWAITVVVTVLQLLGVYPPSGCMYVRQQRSIWKAWLHPCLAELVCMCHTVQSLLDMTSGMPHVTHLPKAC